MTACQHRQVIYLASCWAPASTLETKQAAQESDTGSFFNLLDGTSEVAPIFREWLALHYPQRAARIMARLHQMRGGQDYDSDFATRMKGSGLWAELIRQRFEKTCQRLGFNRKRTELDLSQFRPPCSAGQSSLF